MHSDSDAEEIKDEDLTSNRNISSVHGKEINLEYKPDQQLEMNKIKVDEQVTQLQPARQFLLSDGGEVHNVSPGDRSQPVSLVDPISEGINIAHNEGKEDNVDK